ncbi:hypothetical protein C1H76_9712 [Elsinoe australis]|uniref:Uncharacterized protein n=1 Tax=Elsinoe australis TaxID=40998 RepID=A0A4U7AJY1_9PEZI|nr:hypothetical protein C1H76_9712 [Elsinoe australis]
MWLKHLLIILLTFNCPSLGFASGRTSSDGTSADKPGSDGALVIVASQQNHDDWQGAAVIQKRQIEEIIIGGFISGVLLSLFKEITGLGKPKDKGGKKPNINNTNTNKNNNTAQIDSNNDNSADFICGNGNVGGDNVPGDNNAINMPATTLKVIYRRENDPITNQNDNNIDNTNSNNKTNNVTYNYNCVVNGGATTMIPNTAKPGATPTAKSKPTSAVCIKMQKSFKEAKADTKTASMVRTARTCADLSDLWQSSWSSAPQQGQEYWPSCSDLQSFFKLMTQKMPAKKDAPTPSCKDMELIHSRFLEIVSPKQSKRDVDYQHRSGPLVSVDGIMTAMYKAFSNCVGMVMEQWRLRLQPRSTASYVGNEDTDHLGAEGRINGRSQESAEKESDMVFLVDAAN